MPFIPIPVPPDWKDRDLGKLTVMNTPATYVKWLIDIAKTLGYIPTGDGLMPISLEKPVGVMNGINPNFTLLYTPLPETCHIFVNGQLQTPITNYTILNNIIKFKPTWIPGAGEEILVTYYKLI